MRLLAIAVCSTFLFGVTARAAETPKAPVRIEAADKEATEEGQVKGEEFVDYVVSAKVGQSLSIVLEASNRSAHFDIIGPDSETPFYISAVSGDRFQQNVRENGDHKVRVYLVRRAARKGESASYSIMFRLSPATAQ